MAADQVLDYEVVLANGRFVTANHDTNSDLFWVCLTCSPFQHCASTPLTAFQALRGGGGSAFGVVVSVTVKAYPDIPVTISTFNFSVSETDMTKYAVSDYSNDDFWAVIKHYLSLFPEHADAGIYSYFNIFPSAVAGAQTFTMLPYFAPGKSVAEVDALLASLVSTAAAHGIAITPNTVQYPGFQQAWAAGFPKEMVGLWNTQSGSRLFPRKNWATDASFDTTFAAVRKVVASSFLIGFNIAPTLAAGGVTADETAVNPAWRETVFHAITGTLWDPSLRDFSVIDQYRSNFTNGPMEEWRQVTPGAGAYLAEADTFEPDWRQAFYGYKYAELYSIKRKYDPRGVFFAETAVGAEDWKAGDDRLGRLCRV